MPPLPPALIDRDSRLCYTMAEMEKPFSTYELTVDEDTDEVYVVARDDDAPMDTFRARLNLSDIEPLLRRIHRAVHRT